MVGFKTGGGMMDNFKGAGRQPSFHRQRDDSTVIEARGRAIYQLNG
jgi:hypothetical protein